MIRTRTWTTKSGKERFIRLYGVWCGMKQRCVGSGKDNKNYRDRGITICAEWLGFDAFRSWAIASGYRKGLTIERIDNDGDYRPSNCAFVPKSEQGKNTRRLRLYEYKGESLSIAEWARRVGINNSAMRWRLQNWPIEKAIGLPKTTYHNG